MRVETSFRKFVITESVEQSSNQESAPNVSKSFEMIYSRESSHRNTAPRNFMASLYGFPKTVKKEDRTLSDAELAELDSLGFDTASEIEDDEIIECQLKYSIEEVWGEFGIDQLIFTLKYVKVIGRYCVWNQEKDDCDWFDFEVEDSSPEGRYRWDSAREMIPFYPTGLDVDMKGSFDPAKFEYSLTLGEWN